ncbi:hypothetical protein LWE61_16590 [Sphingobium sufflavum]|uniref:hypothetical protein n=1 Tax=Sphingobium sufflavum TaxID=1129547 RepID=UPI001F36A5BC|nr:hypothetical protein [Sphingobium sufflavum]MCE7798161.1 hypothetical protein [Sphingobium sufflavum]
MSVRIDGRTILLEGRCSVEDAETLLLALQEQPDASVSVEKVQKIHMAVLQILLALKPEIMGADASLFLSQNIFRSLIWNSDTGAKSF